jgi:hypothetical protein
LHQILSDILTTHPHTSFGLVLVHARSYILHTCTHTHAPTHMYPHKRSNMHTPRTSSSASGVGGGSGNDNDNDNDDDDEEMTSPFVAMGKSQWLVCTITYK